MKSDITESLGKSLPTIENQGDGLPETSSDLDHVVLRTKSTTSNQGIRNTLLLDRKMYYKCNCPTPKETAPFSFNLHRSSSFYAM